MIMKIIIKKESDLTKFPNLCFAAQRQPCKL